MNRYIQNGYSNYEDNLFNQISVYENDDPIDTGLLDQHGNKLYRVTEKIKMGFVRSREGEL